MKRQTSEKRNWKTRTLRIEDLEKRELLSVNPLETTAELVPQSCFVLDAEDYDDDLTPAESIALTIDDTLTSQGLDPQNLSESFVFNLNSKPDSTHTIYLDFNGHNTTGTYWNDQNQSGIATITTPVYDVDNDAASFSNQELHNIYEVWLRVSEDFMPFDVNVTTKEPSNDLLVKSSTNDAKFGVRVCIGGSYKDWYEGWTGGSASGVGYVGSFTWNSDTPVFVFSKNCYSAGNVGDAVSHEVGHSLGLRHDGIDPSNPLGSDYYSGSFGWTPIMGSGLASNLTQWSTGEYTGATNLEDDLATISGVVGYRNDDHGSTLATATSLSFVESGTLATGIIERNTDSDYFTLRLNGEQALVRVGGVADISNLDVSVSVYDSGKKFIATYEPTNSLGVVIDVSDFQPGLYYLKVEGSGKILDGHTIYSKYGSLGAYSIETLSLEEDEPNYSESTSTYLGELSKTISLSGSLPSYYDEDYFSFELAEPYNAVAINVGNNNVYFKVFSKLAPTPERIYYTADSVKRARSAGSSDDVKNLKNNRRYYLVLDLDSRGSETYQLTITPYYSAPTPQEWLVDTASDAANATGTTLRKAIENASDGDVIRFDASLSGATIEVQSTLNISKNLTLDASNLSQNVVLDGRGSCRILSSNSEELVVKNITFANGCNPSDDTFQDGAALWYWGPDGGRLLLEDCDFLNNKAETTGYNTIRGAAVAVRGDVFADISRCNFRNNVLNNYKNQEGKECPKSGGAALGLEGAYANIDACLFENNSTNKSGGAVKCIEGQVHFSNSIFFNNNSTLMGGAVHLGVQWGDSESYGVFTSCLFANNKGSLGGAVYGHGEWRNCTIVNNRANAYGAGIYGDGELYNCIVVSNNSEYNANDFSTDLYGAGANVSDAGVGAGLRGDCNLTTRSGLTGSNNKVYSSSLPLFASSSALSGSTNPNDYKLASNSQAWNKGDNSYVTSSMTSDAAGNARIIGVTVDLGAFEYGSTPNPLDAPTITTTTSTTNTITVKWNAVTNSTGYVVAYKKTTDPDSAYTLMSSTTANSRTIPNLVADTSYNVKVYAKGDGSNYSDSPYSSVITVKTQKSNVDPIPLDAPTWKSSSSTYNSITVAWNPVANASGYVVEYKSLTGTTYTPAPQTSSTTTTIPGLASETTYKLRVYAVGDGTYYSNSGYSSVKPITTPPAPVNRETPSTVVTTNEDVVDAYDNKISLREAITLYSSDADTIRFAANMSGKTITLAPALGSLFVSKDLVVDASNLYAESTSTPGVTISGGGAMQILRANRTEYDFTLTIKGISFTDGRYDGKGGAIFFDGATLRLQNCSFSNDAAQGNGNYDLGGGAIHVRQGALVAESCEFKNNFVEFIDYHDGLHTGNGGAIIGETGTSISVCDCYFENNSTVGNYGYGGAIYSEGDVVVDSSRFMNNKAIAYGGAIYCKDQTLTVAGSEFVENSAIYGGAIGSNDAINVQNSRFVQNAARIAGGAIHNWGGILTVDNSEFEENNVNNYGGAIYSSADLIVNGSRFINNSGNCGGAIHSERATITGSVFNENTGNDGGAIYSCNALVVDSSRFVGNNAVSDGDSVNEGGAICCVEATLNVTGSEFVKNSAWNGGAIFCHDTTSTSIESSVIARNNADMYGAGVYLGGENNTLRNLTIADNVSVYKGAGVYAIEANGDVSLYNNVLYNNIASNWNKDSNVYADDSVTSFIGDCNLITGAFTLLNVEIPGGDVIEYNSSAPLFIGANGGSEDDYSYRLAPGSQAINKGANAYAAPQTDLDGAPRIIGGTVDLGAYEYNGVDPTPLDAPTWKSSSSTYNSVTVAWNPVANASGYVVEYKSANDTSYTSIPKTTATTITIPNLASETTYKLHVYAVGDGSNYSNSEYGSVKAVKTKVAPVNPLTAPTITTATATTNSITVKWNAVTNSTGYVVAYKKATDPDSAYVVMSSTTAISRTIVNLDANTSYNVKVYAKGDGSNYSDSPYSAAVTVKTKPSPGPLDVPTITTATSTTNTITVKWNAVTNSTGYVVAYKKATDPESAYTVMSSTTAISRTIPNLVANTSYNVKVYAKGDGTNTSDSPYSAAVTVKTQPEELTPLDAPTWKSSSSTYNSVTVTWNAVANSSGYVVEYKSANDSGYTSTPKTTATTITIPGLASETTYKLRVYAVGDGTNYSNSTYSAIKAVKTKVAPVAPTPLTAPTITTATATTNTITVKWNAVTNSTGYVVAYKKATDPESAYTVMSSTTATSRTISNLAANTSYNVKVYAKGDGSNYSDSSYSAVKTVKTPGTSGDVPSTVVTSLADTVDANDGVVTLREAITVYANDGDAVTFAPELKGGTITLSGSQIVIDKAITVSARALLDKTNGVPGITIDANSASRIFRITGDTVWLDSIAFTGGNGGGAGGAVYAYHSTLTISNSNFLGNTGTYGGAVYADSSTLMISNAGFQNNTVEGEGGGAAINAYRSKLILSNSSFQNNSAYYGGAIYSSYSTLSISNADFQSNTASGLGGGAIGAQVSTLVVSNATIQNNAAEYGGAFDLVSSELTLSNTIVAKNRARNASALYLTSANVRVFNATLYGNVASNSSSNRTIFVSANSHLDVHNTIVAGNTGADFYKADVRSVVSAYNVLSGYTGWTNADAIAFAYNSSKPLFTNAAQGDYTLAPGSQAINMGDDVYVYAEKDLAGNTRVSFDAVDLGAYEYGTELDAPKIKSSSSTNRSITVAWNPVANATGYVVAYESSADSAYVETPMTTATTYTLVNLAPATEYKVKVLAKGDGTDYSDSLYGSVKTVRTTANAVLDEAFAEFFDEGFFE